MNNPKVLLCGNHDALFQTMRLSSAAAIEVEQYSGQHDAFHWNSLQEIGMVVVLNAPPQIDGLPVVRNWKRENPDIPVVVATSDYSGATTRLLFKSGAVDVLELPADQDRMLACYEAYLPQFRSKRPVSPKKHHLSTAKLLMTAVTPGMLLAGAGTAMSSPGTFLPVQHQIEQGIEDTSCGFDI